MGVSPAFAAARKRRGQTSVHPESHLSEDDEEDYLQSSQKTVCSDAFDFLFDSNNLDPKKVMEKVEKANGNLLDQVPDSLPQQKQVTVSTCCNIS